VKNINNSLEKEVIRRKGECFYKPLKWKIKSIENQRFFILLKFILDNSEKNNKVGLVRLLTKT
jgi:hypothetical protein